MIYIYLKSADQPTNINWENCHKPLLEKFFRSLAILIVIGIAVFVVAFVVYTKKLNRQMMRKRYPTVDCEIVESEAGNFETMKQYAFIEWYNIYQHGGTRK